MKALKFLAELLVLTFSILSVIVLMIMVSAL